MEDFRADMLTTETSRHKRSAAFYDTGYFGDTHTMHAAAGCDYDRTGDTGQDGDRLYRPVLSSSHAA